MGNDGEYNFLVLRGFEIGYHIKLQTNVKSPQLSFSSQRSVLVVSLVGLKKVVVVVAVVAV